MRLHFGKYKILFGDDLNQAAEKYLLKHYTGEKGSKASNEMIEEAKHWFKSEVIKKKIIMKRKYMIIGMILFCSNVIGQKIAPDIEVVSQIISDKQDEIKQRVLRNLVVKNIQTTNYTTYNTAYNLVDILTTEKNKHIMTKRLISEITDYSITYSLAQYFIKEQLKLDDYFDSVELKNADLKNADLYEFMAAEFVTSEANTESKQKVNKANDQSKMFKSVLANFVIDNLDSLLKRPSFLQAKGMFKPDNLSKDFKFGLNLDYSLLEKNGLDKVILKQLSDYVIQINTTLQSTNDVFKWINDSKKKIDDFGTIDKCDIGFILKLFSVSLENFRVQIGKNSFIARIGDIITKYVIYDFPKDPEAKGYDFSIDVEAIILSLEDEFYNKRITGLINHKVGVKPYFVIGMNYGIMTNENNAIPTEDYSESIYDIAYVSEKIGIKILFADYEYTRSHKPMDWYKYRGKYWRWKGPVRAPLVNNIYAIIYGSGVIYNVVDLKSQKNYNFAMAGAGLGVAFFNDLELNISYSVPFIKDEDPFENGMINFAFDIPIFTYIKGLKK